MKVTVDLNVLLDVAQNRLPHYHASEEVVHRVRRGEFAAVLPGHTLTTLHDIARVMTTGACAPRQLVLPRREPILDEGAPTGADFNIVGKAVTVAATGKNMQLGRDTGGPAGAGKIEAVFGNDVGVVGGMNEKHRWVGLRQMPLRGEVVAKGVGHFAVKPILERTVPVGSHRGDDRVE